MSRIKYITLLVTMFIGIVAVKAAIPPSWNVNSSNYGYNMTLTAQVELNCELNLAPNNTLAAFVGTECRGVAPTSINGINIALMFIHSNSNSGEIITFKYYDSTADSVYNLSQTIVFHADSALGTAGTPFYILGSYHPTSIEINNATIYDTTHVDDLVGELNVLDLDVSDVYTLELIEELDYDHFYLVGNEVFVAETPNVINDSIYNVVFKGTSNGGTCIIQDTLQISLVNTYIEPIYITLSNDIVYDYSVIGDTVGLFSLDNISDAGTSYNILDTLSTSYGYFVMVDNYLVLNHTIDILTETSYEIYVRADGGTTSYVDSIFTITLSNTNTPPTAIHISNDTVFDYSNPGDYIGLFTVDDSNENANYTYSFNSNGSFQNDYFILTDNELYFNHDVNILTETSYQLHITAYDGVAYSIDSVFTITLNNTNDEPTSIELSMDTVYDYTDVGDIIGEFSVEDIDTNASYTYTLKTNASVQNDYFILTDNQLYLNHEIDILTETSYQLHIKAYDGIAYSIDSVFTITLNNTNDEPTSIELSNDTVFDYTEVGTLIGEFTVMDVDTDAVYSLSLESNASVQNDYFILTDNQLYLNHEIDILTETSYQLHIKAYDGVAYSIDSVFTITLNNTNDEPTSIELSNDTVFDYTEIGALIGAFTVMDLDTDAVYSFSLESNASVQNNYFILTNNQLYLNHEIDILTEISYQLHIKAYDGVAYSIDSVFTITLNNTNDEPTSIELSNDTVFDYTEVGTLIGEFTVMDVDTDAVYSLSLESNASVQNDYFILTDNQLYLNHEIDILTETSYQLHIKAYDGVAYSIDSVFTITLNNTNDEPTSIELSNDTVFDYTEVGTFIGEFTVMDVDTDAVYSLSLESNASVQNDYFILTDNQLYLNHEIDILTETSYQLHIKAYDGVAYSIDSVFTITLNNTNDEPTSIELSNDTVFDYTEVGALIGEFTVMDIDTDAFYSLSLESNASVQNDYFILTDNQLYLNHEIDILTETSYQVHIKGYDGIYGIDSVFTIVINNTNNAPTAIEINNNIIYDYSLPGDGIGSLSVTDVDIDEVYTLSLDSTVLDNSKFLLNAGELILNHSINVATETVYDVQIEAYDGHAYTIIDTLHIVINNTNVYPYSFNLSNTNVYDYSVVGDTVGVLSVDDANATESYIYSLSNTTDFFLLGNNLILNKNIDVLTDTIFTIEASAYDGVIWTIDTVFTVNVLNTNIEPTSIDISNSIIYDYTESGDAVGQLTVQDANENTVYTLSLGSGYDESLFQLVNNELQCIGTLDPLAGHYQVSISAYDGVLWTIDTVLTITVENTNAEPTALEIDHSVIYDYTQSGDFIGYFSVQDSNTNAEYSYSLGTGYDANLFQIVNNELQFIGTVNPMAGNYEIAVSAYDGTLWTIDSVITITVQNTNAEPTAIEIDHTLLYDYTIAGAHIGSLSVVDTNTNATYSYSLGNSYNENLFQLVDNQVQFIGTIDPLAGAYQVEIIAYDGVLWTIDTVLTFTIQNTNIAPTSINVDNAILYDYTQTGDLVGALTVMDDNQNANYSYTLGTNYNENLFQLVNNQLQFTGTIDPLVGNYQVEVIAYDGVLWTIDTVFTITVQNTNAEPTAINVSHSVIYDYTQSGDLVGDLSVSDANSNQEYVYTLGSGNHENLFQLVDNHLQFVGTVNPMAGSYNVQIIAYDGSLWTIDSILTITVQNTNIEPTAVHISNSIIYDYTQNGDIVGNIDVTDINTNATYSYSIESGYDESLFQLVDNELQFIGVVNPLAGNYQVKINAYDGVLWSIDTVFTIIVQNTNAQPTALHLNNTTIYDYTQSGDLVGELNVTDANGSGMYMYSLGTGYNEGLFQIVGNQLQFTGTVDALAGTYEVSISAYDGSLWTIDSVYTITVQNTNSSPLEIVLSASEVYNYTMSGSAIGTLTVTDSDINEAYLFELKPGYDISHFQLVNNELQFVGSVDLSKSEYKIHVSAYDGRLWTIDSVFTIQVINTNSEPTQLNLSNTTVFDYDDIGTEIGVLSVDDVDNNEEYTYTLSTQFDGGKFNLDGNVLYLMSAFNPSETEYIINISAYDGNQWTIDSVFTISLENTNTAPTDIRLSTSDIDENLDSLTRVGYIEIEDEGIDEVHTYALTFEHGNNDNTFFKIIDNELISLASFDYEDQTMYTVEITVTDKVENTYTKVLSIDINDVVESTVLENNNYVTPNNDGVNDFWEIESVDIYEDFSLEIFNKHGQKVFQTSSGYDNTWDGKNLDGDELPEGVYFYYFINSESGVTFKGNIHILK